MTTTPDRTPQRVLIVDASDDSREVLRTILSKRGVQIFEAREEQAGLEIAQRQHPDVIVLDTEGSSSDFDACDKLAEQADSDRASVVLLGNIKRWNGAAPREIVRKPYHYGPLIRKIEALLAESPLAESSCAAGTQPVAKAA